MEIEKVRQSVPDTPALDRLMRYQASLERAFDRTLTQLERAQRLSQGPSGSSTYQSGAKLLTVVSDGKPVVWIRKITKRTGSNDRYGIT